MAGGRELVILENPKIERVGCKNRGRAASSIPLQVRQSDLIPMTKRPNPGGNSLADFATPLAAICVPSQGGLAPAGILWSFLRHENKDKINSDIGQDFRTRRHLATEGPTPEGSHKLARVSKPILSLSEKSSVDPWKHQSLSKVQGAKRPGTVRKENETRFAW